MEGRTDEHDGTGDEGAGLGSNGEPPKSDGFTSKSESGNSSRLNVVDLTSQLDLPNDGQLRFDRGSITSSQSTSGGGGAKAKGRRKNRKKLRERGHVNGSNGSSAAMPRSKSYEKQERIFGTSSANSATSSSSWVQELIVDDPSEVEAEERTRPSLFSVLGESDEDEIAEDASPMRHSTLFQHASAIATAGALGRGPAASRLVQQRISTSGNQLVQDLMRFRSTRFPEDEFSDVWGTQGDNDDDMQKAIEESFRMHRGKDLSEELTDDAALAKALEESLKLSHCPDEENPREQAQEDEDALLARLRREDELARRIMGQEKEAEEIESRRKQDLEEERLMLNIQLESLRETNPAEIVDEVARIYKEMKKQHRSQGGALPSLEYCLSLAQDRAKEREREKERLEKEAQDREIQKRANETRRERAARFAAAFERRNSARSQNKEEDKQE